MNLFTPLCEGQLRRASYIWILNSEKGFKLLYIVITITCILLALQLLLGGLHSTSCTTPSSVIKNEINQNTVNP